MKQMVKYFTFLLILNLILVFQIKAQVYPVQINTQLIPPYSLRLSDYVSPGTNRVGLNMLLTDLNKPEYYVRLELTIEGDGITIKTKPSFNPGPVILEGGIPQYFTSSDLAEWFDPRNLDFSGFSKSDYLATGRLPEGVYRFSFRAYDYNKRVRVSNNSTITAWLLLNDPPIINLPFPDHKVEHIHPQNIVFQWTPRHTGSPNSAFSTEYEFTLVEIWPEGRNPNDAILTGIPVFQTTTTNTTLVYGLAEPFLEPGRQYAYRIQARDMDERDMFKNNGYTEVRMLTFGDECKLVENLTAKSERFSTAEISWTPSFTQTAFSVRYRKADDSEAEWFEEETFLDHITINDLQELTTYEYQVMGYCGTYEGDYTELQTFTTADLKIEEFECGGTDEENTITNHNPLPVLRVDDYIWSGKFMFKIAEVKGSNGTFTGKAYAMIPYLSFIKLMAEFENIKVNTDNQVYEGEITSIYNPDSPFVIGISIGGDDDEGDAGDGTGGSDDGTDDSVVSDTTFTTTIDSVYISGDEIIVVTEDGTTDTIPTTDDIIITDSDGDTWLVTDGTVVGGAGGSGTGSGTGTDTDVPAVEEAEIKIKADFMLYDIQNFGYDKLTYDVHKPMYEQREVYDETEYVSWKSISSSGSDKVLVKISDYDTIITPENVRFRTLSGVDILSFKHEGKDDILQLILNGKADEEKETIEAYVTYKDASDTSDTEKEIVVGVLNTISYNKQNINLVIVPVNGSAGFSAADFTNALNEIYKQSVVNWNVTLDDVFNIDVEEWDTDKDDKMNDGESTFLSNYSNEQIKFKRQYKRDRDMEKNSYYVFVLNNIPSKSGLAGYMPLKEQYAFIHSATSSNAAQLIAHELGHGAFRLWHTFSSESDYFMSEKSSDNLMDYNDGERLHKYQWDFIHNPEGGFYMFTDEDEGAMTSEFFSESFTRLFDNVYENNKKGRLYYFEKIKNSSSDTEELDYNDDEDKEWIKSWNLRTLTNDQVFNNVTKAIKNAGKGEVIGEIILRPKHIYLGKCIYDDKEYPYAIYRNYEGKNIDDVSYNMTKMFTKVQIAEISELKNDQIKKYFYSDENRTEYLIIGLFEEGKSSPTVILQIEKFIGDRSLKKWLEYLNIYKPDESNFYSLKESVYDEGRDHIIEKSEIFKALSDYFTTKNIDETKAKLSLYDDGFKNFDAYMEEAQENNYDLGDHEGWSVRKSSFVVKNNLTLVQRVIQKILDNETSFSLHKQGIFLGKYELQGKEYKLAVYSEVESINTEKVRVNRLNDLSGNSSIKVGIKEEYILIAFFNKSNELQFVIQVDNGSVETAKLWLKYLGVLVEDVSWMEENVLPYWEKLFGEKELDDGTKIGDPLPNPIITNTSNNQYKGYHGCVRFTGTCRDEYNNMSYTNRYKTHDGIDFTAEVGTPIHAIKGGTIYYVDTTYLPMNPDFANDNGINAEGNPDDNANCGCDYGDGYGNQIKIRCELSEPVLMIDGQEITTVYMRYGHLDTVFVRNGDYVKVGDIIGLVGCSGNAATYKVPEKQNYHVHIEADNESSISDARMVNVLDLITTEINQPEP